MLYRGKGRQRRHRSSHGAGRHQKAFKSIIKNAEIFKKLKRIEEDILKHVFETKERAVAVETLEKEFENVNGNLKVIIKLLQDKSYLCKENNHYVLTPEGNRIAELIVRIHVEIENYIQGKNMHCNAHQMAHILEHELTEEEIEKMIKASEFQGRGRPITDFNLNSGIIVNVNLESCKIWTKLISIGLFPGQRIDILNRAGPNYLLNVKGSKIAIDNLLAAGIFLIP